VSDLRFDGHVAIVTGAGGNPSLGRSYAMLLAERGAKVVVNDLGVGPDGRSIQRASAQSVVDEIRAAGGEAVADEHSVAEPDSAQAIIDGALEAYVKVDILINNAGVVALALFAAISRRDIDRILGVHLHGTVNMNKAVWGPMSEAGYGRIVNITSSALMGFHYTSIYGAAKGGILSLTRSLAIEGGPLGIKVNTLGPYGASSSQTYFNDPDQDYIRYTFEHCPPELVAPAVAYLCHEECPISGRYLESGAGRTAERFMAETVGYTDTQLTLESFRDHLSEVIDREGFTVLPDPDPTSETPFKPRQYQPD
jgi:NAD(P)-dependent dehydrogenase (short-subunit alcohol dehydrogenase family)